jgi:hypothetical protein
LRKSLTLLLVCVGLGFGQEAPPPECKPITYFGVSGCEPTGQGECPKGYHVQVACPTNPMIKAPCRKVCVADSAPEEKTGPKAKPKPKAEGQQPER